MIQNPGTSSFKSNQVVIIRTFVSLVIASKANNSFASYQREIMMHDRFYLFTSDQCWGSLLLKVMYYTLHITLKNSNALHYMITPWRK